MPVGPIPNELKTGGVAATLDQIAITDPDELRLLAQTVADQMHAQTTGPKFEDLSDAIADIQIETAVQGASFLEVHIIDPNLQLLYLPKDPNDVTSTFIQVAADGYLDPPIRLQFPPGGKTFWRLCSVRASTITPGSADANLILTFEDEVAAVLRTIDASDIGAAKQAAPDASLEAYMGQVIAAAARSPKATGVSILGVSLIDETNDPNSVQVVNAEVALSQALAAVQSIPSNISPSSAATLAAGLNAGATQAAAAWADILAAQAAGSAALAAGSAALAAISDQLTPYELAADAIATGINPPPGR